MIPNVTAAISHDKSPTKTEAVAQPPEVAQNEEIAEANENKNSEALLTPRSNGGDEVGDIKPKENMPKNPTPDVLKDFTSVFKNSEDNSKSKSFFSAIRPYAFRSRPDFTENWQSNEKNDFDKKIVKFTYKKQDSEISNFYIKYPNFSNVKRKNDLAVHKDVILTIVDIMNYVTMKNESDNEYKYEYFDFNNAKNILDVINLFKDFARENIKEEDEFHKGLIYKDGDKYSENSLFAKYIKGKLLDNTDNTYNINKDKILSDLKKISDEFSKKCFEVGLYSGLPYKIKLSGNEEVVIYDGMKLWEIPETCIKRFKTINNIQADTVNKNSSVNAGESQSVASDAKNDNTKSSNNTKNTKIEKLLARKTSKKPKSDFNLLNQGSNDIQSFDDLEKNYNREEIYKIFNLIKNRLVENNISDLSFIKSIKINSISGDKEKFTVVLLKNDNSSKENNKSLNGFEIKINRNENKTFEIESFLDSDPKDLQSTNHPKPQAKGSTSNDNELSKPTKKENTESTNEIKDLKEKNKELENKNKESVEENSKLKEKIKKFEEENKKLTNQIKDLKEKNKELEDKNKESVEENSKLKEKIKKLGEENKKLTQKSKATSLDLSKVNSGAYTEESNLPNSAREYRAQLSSRSSGANSDRKDSDSSKSVNSSDVEFSSQPYELPSSVTGLQADSNENMGQNSTNKNSAGPAGGKRKGDEACEVSSSPEPMRAASSSSRKESDDVPGRNPENPQGQGIPDRQELQQR